jgi:hypothetical protein
LTGSWLSAFWGNLPNSFDCLALQMGPTGFPEMSVTTNQCCVTSQKNEDLKIELDVPKQMQVNVDDKKANIFEKF